MRLVSAVAVVPAKGLVSSALEEDGVDRLEIALQVEPACHTIERIACRKHSNGGGDHWSIAISRLESFLQVYFMNLAAVRI